MTLPPASPPAPPPPAPWEPPPGPPAGPPAAPPPAEPPRAVDLLLRVLAMLLAVAGGAVAAALAVLLIPLRVGSFGLTDSAAASVRLPVAIALAVAGNVALVWFARAATGLRWAPLLPGLSWFAVIVLAMNTTTEGDRLLMPNDWVGTVTLFAGTITLVVSGMLVAVPTKRANDLP